jgi:hypothetical protein
MHLDMTQILPAQAVTDIENVAARFGYTCPSKMWQIWLNNVDTRTTSINILQAAAQMLSSFGCVIATLRFGLYCSRHFSMHGNILSDDVALHYLRISFNRLTKQKGAILDWLQNEEGFEYDDNHRSQFWIQACAAYAYHEYDANPAHIDESLEFAFQFLLNEG